MTYDLKFFINAQIRIFKTNGTFHNFVKKKTNQKKNPTKTPTKPPKHQPLSQFQISLFVSKHVEFSDQKHCQYCL